MFDVGFALMFRAIDRIRVQLESADRGLKKYLAEELTSLRRLGDQYMDHWMALDEQIGELFETFELPTQVEEVVPAMQMKQSTHQTNVAPQRTGTNPYVAGSAYPTNRSKDTVTLLTAAHEIPEEWEAHAFDASDALTVSLRKGMGYYDLLLYEEAAQSFADVVSSSDNIVARLYLAAAHAGRMRFDMALDHLTEVRKRSKDSLILCAAHEVEAQIHLANERAEDAAKCLNEIVRLMPNYQDVWFNLGVCHALANEDEMAERAFTKAVEIDKTDREALQLLAVMQLKRRRTDEAERTIRFAQTKYPRHVGIMLLQSHVHHVNGEYQKRIQLCREIIRMNPDCKQAWSHLAWSLLEIGQGPDAVATLKKYLSTQPSDIETLVQLGIAHFLQDDLQKAENTLLHCLPRYSDKSYIWIALGRISAVQGKCEQAFRRFLRALRDKRKSVKQLALYYYACTLFENERFQEAEKYLRAAMVLGGRNKAILIALSQTVQKLGRGYEAEKLFARARKDVTITDTIQ